MASQGATLQQLAPRYLQELAGRYDAGIFEPLQRRARVRLGVEGVGEWDAVLEGGSARVTPARSPADALISARPATWELIAADPRTRPRGVSRRAPGGAAQHAPRHRLPGRHQRSQRVLQAAFRDGPTRRGPRISTIQAGSGEPLIAIHGLGGTKGSFLPTVTELAPHFRVIAADLPGFGDSAKPLRASYDPAYFARSIIALMDALATGACASGREQPRGPRGARARDEPPRTGRARWCCCARRWRGGGSGRWCR